MGMHEKGIQILSMIFTVSLFLSIPAIADESSSVAYDDLVEYWAPTIYQDVTTEYDVRADFITRFDFDGDWSGVNNWENTFFVSAYIGCILLRAGNGNPLFYKLLLFPSPR